MSNSLCMGRRLAYRPACYHEHKEGGVEWDGEGLPPVGCEFEWKKIGVSKKWNYGFAVGFDKDGDLVVQRENSLAGLRTKTHPGSYDFRPIRTPEQRAVEAMEDALRETGVASRVRRVHANSIYTAIREGRIPGVKLEDKS